jgi:hypothetical protein
MHIKNDVAKISIHSQYRLADGISATRFDALQAGTSSGAQQ